MFHVIFGLPMSAMPIQVRPTFILGSGFYAIRRMSGTLSRNFLPVAAHGVAGEELVVLLFLN